MTVARTAAPWKMHGAGNVFFLVDGRAGPGAAAEYSALARALCERPAVGADGLLVVLAPSSSEAIARMRMFNPDGSEAEMCGNGMRCVARYLIDTGAPDGFAVDSGAGPIACLVVSRTPFRVRLTLGAVHVAPADEMLAALGRLWRFRRVRVGNPHAIVIVPDTGALRALPLPELAAAFAADSRFQEGVNVHAVVATGPSHIAMRHFERGAGETQACGTGAVAAAAVAVTLGLADSPVRVDVPGGRLDVAWQAGTAATLTGPADYLGPRDVASPLP